LVPNYIAALPLDPKFDVGGQCYLYRSDGTDYMMITHGTMKTIKGGDPSHADNPVHIRQMDRPAHVQPTIAVYTEGAKN
jgi:hypothetical protein